MRPIEDIVQEMASLAMILNYEAFAVKLTAAIEARDAEWNRRTPAAPPKAQGPCCNHFCAHPTPSEPCSTCKGKREVLFLSQRGPGDPPGNQMIACPVCRAGTPRGDE